MERFSFQPGSDDSDLSDNAVPAPNGTGALGQPFDPSASVLGRSNGPIDYNALIGLIGGASQRDSRSNSPASPEFLDALRKLLTADSARETNDPPAAVSVPDRLDPHADPFAYLNSLLRSGASSDVVLDDVKQPRPVLPLTARP